MDVSLASLPFLSWIEALSISDVIGILGIIASLSGSFYFGRKRFRRGKKKTLNKTTTVTTKKVVKKRSRSLKNQAPNFSIIGVLYRGGVFAIAAVI